MIFVGSNIRWKPDIEPGNIFHINWYSILIWIFIRFMWFTVGKYLSSNADLKLENCHKGEAWMIKSDKKVYLRKEGQERLKIRNFKILNFIKPIH